MGHVVIAPAISIHALREEGDRLQGTVWQVQQNFNPRPPRGGRQLPLEIRQRFGIFQSTPSARRATAGKRHNNQQNFISIHALREEGDKRKQLGKQDGNDFNPRPPRGGRRCFCFHSTQSIVISIHALREEGDLLYDLLKAAFDKFQSTPSARRATAAFLMLSNGCKISIHALREEGDFLQVLDQVIAVQFQSTPSARRATAKAAKNPPRLFHYTHLCTI